MQFPCIHVHEQPVIVRDVIFVRPDVDQVAWRSLGFLDVFELFYYFVSWSSTRWWSRYVFDDLVENLTIGPPSSLRLQLILHLRAFVTM